MRRWLMVVAVMMLAATGIGAGEIPPVLRMSAIPDGNPTELSRIYTPFAEYLHRTIGMPVQFTPVVDYAATVEGMVAAKLDRLRQRRLDVGPYHAALLLSAMIRRAL